MADQEFHHSLRRVTLWPIGLLLVAGVVLIVLVQFLLHSAQRVEHTDAVIARAHQVERKLVDMETGLRGFQLTAEPVFLQPYERANAGIKSELQMLSGLVRDNPARTEAVRRLHTRVDEWRAFAEEALGRRRDGAGLEETTFDAGGALTNSVIPHA